jgi:O-antigen/teichoic acid export membrane protein
MRLARVINNSAALFSLDILSKAMPLLVFPVMVRALGPQSYGKLGFATAASGFFGLLASPGFSTYATREASRDPAQLAFLVRHVLGARITFAIGSYAILAIFTFTLAPKDFSTRGLLLLTGLAFLINSVDTQWIYTARSRMWMVALRGAVGQVLYGALILLFVRRPSDVWIAPVSSAFALIVGALLIWFPARREFQIPAPVIAPRMWRGFLPVCFIMGLASMMSMIYDQIDTVMLRYLRTETEVGVYVASYRMMTIAMSFTFILGQVFFPLLSSTSGGDDANQQRYLRWLGRGTVGLAVPIAVGGFILATPLTRLVLGAQYSGTSVLFRWLMLTVVAGPLASYFGAQLIPHAREKKYLWSVVAGAAANVVLNLVFIPRFGALAAVFTTAISQASVAVLNAYFTRDLPRPSLFNALGLSLAASGWMAAAVLLARSFFAWHVLILVAVGAATYAAVYWGGLMLWNRTRATSP